MKNVPKVSVTMPTNSTSSNTNTTTTIKKIKLTVPMLKKQEAHEVDLSNSDYELFSVLHPAAYVKKSESKIKKKLYSSNFWLYIYIIFNLL